MKSKKPKGAKHRNLVVGAGVILVLGLAACAHKGPPRQPWEQWARPGGTEEQRASDYADCANQGNDIYRACMVARGWRMAAEPGSPDRAVPPNYGH